ncbi:MAG: aminotransferase class I/II-fold pyridoxal phosphate-dependent enzyme [Acidobacteriota bacterium]
MDKPRKIHKRRKEEYRTRTHLIHGNYESRRWDYDHHVIPPISSSATYRLSSTHRGAQGFQEFGTPQSHHQQDVPIYIYDRLDEPTRGMLEENLAYAEGGQLAVTFATGMAAVSAALGVTLATGDEVIAHPAMYGCTYSLLTNWYARYRIPMHSCDLTRPERLRKLVNDRTRVVYFETPVNPTLDLIDISAVRSILDEVNSKRPAERRVLMIIDNTFATPYCQRPLHLGADMVVHSLTKNIGGFGTDMGGAVITSEEFLNQLMLYRKDFGGVLSSKSAWAILVYGLPTLAARMANQQKTAQKVAEFLERHPKVARVRYPGLDSFPQRDLARKQMISPDGKFAPGSIVYFELRANGGAENIAAEQFIDQIANHSYTTTLAVSLGQIKTLIENPFSMTHAALPPELKKSKGIEPGGIRLSVGLEDWHDIIEDLGQALDQVGSADHQTAAEDLHGLPKTGALTQR